MGKITGFLEFDRQEQKYAPAADRVRHYHEFLLPLDEHDLVRQAARCMDCGIPFCQGHSGCPVSNQIPDWNNLVYAGDWKRAADNLHSTNNFPEITGPHLPRPVRGRPARSISRTRRSPSRPSSRPSPTGPTRKAGSVPQPAEQKTASASPSSAPVRQGWPPPNSSPAPATRCTCSSAIARPGGLLRYGIPDFKMEKHCIDRRVEQMQAEGVIFHTNVDVGHDRSAKATSRGPRRRAARRRGQAAARSADRGSRPRRHPLRHGFPAAAEPPRFR